MKKLIEKVLKVSLYQTVNPQLSTVKLSLYMPRRHMRKVEVLVYLHSFLTSVLNGDEWSA
jgi:hypothetical protein